MAKQDLVTIEVRLQPDAPPPRIAGAKLVKVFPGDPDPELGRTYLAYVAKDKVNEVLQDLDAHPQVETARVLERRKITP